MEAQTRFLKMRLVSFQMNLMAIALVTLLIALLLGAQESPGQLLRRGANPPAPNARATLPRHVVQTKYFIVDAPDPVLARKVAEEAERFRTELAIEWLGHELGEWEDKCPITVELARHAGGETSFAFVTDRRNQGRPRSWEMRVFGPPDRILDSVLPHEITHTIFASHFGRPLPRWADEGACTIVEHESERAKNHQMLMDFLRSNRGIPFNRMFEMKQYPQDILPLYAQGHSLSKFLVMQKGKRYFLDYIEAGMQAESKLGLLEAWNRTTQSYYGFRDLSDLQESWIAWVRAGSKEIPATDIAAKVSNPPNNRPQPERFASTDAPRSDSQHASLASQSNRATPAPSTALLASHQEPVEDRGAAETESWYIRQSRGQKALSQRQPFVVPPVGLAEASPGSSADSNRMFFQDLEDLRKSERFTPRASNENKQTIWR